MTDQTEFVRGYAAALGISAAEAKRRGLWPTRCDCTQDGCEGWRMSYPKGPWLHQPREFELAQTLPLVETVRTDVL